MDTEIKSQNKDYCVYGGSYDPCTLGHYHLIEKAATIFDRVYVVLAENAKKKSSSMFSEETRLAMLKDIADSINEKYPVDIKVIVTSLSPSVYLASYADQLGAKFLIRGIRDQIDFGYEQTIYRTNRRIQPKIETIYLMPDDAYSLVSSSWVKSLIGCAGWIKVVDGCVIPFVLKELQKRYLKDRFMELAHGPLQHLLRGNAEPLWKEICDNYGPKDFHGFNHLITMLENLYAHVVSPDPLMVYSIFLHDIDPSEDKSAEIAADNMRMVSRHIDEEDPRDKVLRLIKATKHNTCEYSKEDEQIIVSMDLLTLAVPPDEYDVYVDKIFNEYLKTSGKSEQEFIPLWNKVRSDFLKKMLDRKVIFPWDQISKSLESQAIENMKAELKRYE